MRPYGRRESRLYPEDGRARSSGPEKIAFRTSGALKSEPLLVLFGTATVYEIQLEGHTILHRTPFRCTSKSHFRHAGCGRLAKLAPTEHLEWCTKPRGRTSDRLYP